MPTEKTRRICTTRAPAKVNLSLEVLGSRPDGYHEIRSLMVGVGLFDELEAEASGATVGFSCDTPALRGLENLAVRAASLLAEKTEVEPGVRLVLRKRIPIAAGLGGGSSDAAAALRLCNELWRTRLSPIELSELASWLGSDVPFFFHLPSALIEGRGERVTPLPLRWRGWVVLVMPDIPVSTAAVYAAWRPADSGSGGNGVLAASETRHAERSEASPGRCRSDVLSRRAGIRCAQNDATNQSDSSEPRANAHSVAERIAGCATADEIAALAVNQLELAAFRVEPRLRELFDALSTLNVGRPRVSGSGSTMYLLFDDPQSAAQAASLIRSRISQVQTVTAEAPVGEVAVECI